MLRVSQQAKQILEASIVKGSERIGVLEVARIIIRVSRIEDRHISNSRFLRIRTD